MNKFVTEKVPTASKTFSIDVKAEITCMAANKEFSLVACVGRQVFKVFGIEDDHFTERHNLRPAHRSTLSYVAVDIVWSPRDENILASAASNGHVVFWDLNKPMKQKQDHVSPLHERAASGISFHSTESLLLSGGKDGMCKIFDTRKREVAYTFPSVSVHDVQWWPNQCFIFAAATENGSIQIWDYRNPASHVFEFTAHNGPVFTIDFHPDEKNKLASGGRDKLIKVWSLPQSVMTGQHSKIQTHGIQTIAPLAKVRWRPKRSNQIASIVNSFDLGVNVWELTRPSIPFATFTEHSDVVTSIIWKDAHEFISGGKDSKLVMHSFKDAMRLSEKANPIAISLDKDVELALALNDRLLLSSSQYSGVKGASNPSMSHPSASGGAGNKVMTLFRTGLSKPDKREEFIKDKISSLYFFQPANQEFNANHFKYCANNYVLYGRPFEEMCQHNSEIAGHCKKVQIMKHWLLLKTMFNSVFDAQSHTFLPPNLSNPRSITVEVPPVRVEVNGAAADTKLIHGNYSNQENGDITSGVSGDEDYDDNFQSNSATQTANHDFFFEDNEIDGFELDLDEKDDEYFEDEQDFDLPTESFIPPHDLTDAGHPQSSLAYHSHRIPFYAENHYLRDKLSEQRSPEKISVIPAAFDIPLWDSVSAVISLLHSYAEDGDVQTAVSMHIVLGNKIKSQIDEELLENWMTAYLDLLEMFKLWCVSNTIITKCSLKNIQQLNQASTTIYTVCASCQKPLLTEKCGWYCKKCQKITSLCSICHTPVKGIYVCCQGCAHGGHISHMKDWFKSNTQCPTGCGHECEWT